VRVAGLDRQDHDLIASVNTGLQPSDYVLKYIADAGEPFLDAAVAARPLAIYDRDPASFGQDRYFLTNPPGHEGTYEGLEVTVDGALLGGWRTRFDGALYRSYTRGSNRGFSAVENDAGSLGELFENPNAETYARGHPFFDRAYVMKWWTSYPAPKHWIVSAIARYQDGQPFARVVVVPDLNQGPEAVQGYRRGQTRFTYTLSLDTHVAKTFSVGRANVAGILEVFNLLNTRKEVEEDIVTSASFRRTTAVQPPRAVRLALRLGF
jgi:hypothetical protein